MGERYRRFFYPGNFINEYDLFSKKTYFENVIINTASAEIDVEVSVGTPHSRKAELFNFRSKVLWQIEFFIQEVFVCLRRWIRPKLVDQRDLLNELRRFRQFPESKHTEITRERNKTPTLGFRRTLMRGNCTEDFSVRDRGTS